MKRIYDKDKIKYYLERSGFLDCFSFDAKDDAQLYFAPKGSLIIREGDLASHLYFLFEGRAKIYQNHSNGKVSLMHLVESPSFLGEMELLDIGKNSIAWVAATDNCYFFALPIKEYRERLLNDATFLRLVCTYLCDKNFRGFASYGKKDAFPLENRLADFILFTAEGDVYREKHTLASEFLRVSYRHLLYVLADFVKNGYLEKAQGGYVICDIAALEELAIDAHSMFSSEMKKPLP